MEKRARDERRRQTTLHGQRALECSQLQMGKWSKVLRIATSGSMVNP
jgi:hypothetical protein